MNPRFPGILLLFTPLWPLVLAAAPQGRGSADRVDFVLKAEPPLTAVSRTSKVDVNLGNTPESFVHFLWKQLTGKEAPAAWASGKAKLLGSKEAPRRIDLALLLAAEAGVHPDWIYSDPWAEQVDLHGSPPRKRPRSIGAVMMFFFTCPKPPNGTLGWANNHAPGMAAPASILTAEGDSGAAKGMYHPANPGFWYRELRDARYAGLDFVLPNVYGPDLTEENLGPLMQALERLRRDDGEDRVKLGMFDDTWIWGQPHAGPAWLEKPDCSQIEAASERLYTAKWKPFFQRLPREHWYLVKGRPFIYFYNANTLQRREHFDRVLAGMKERFRADFGTEPFVAVDQAFHASPDIQRVSDSSFQWFPLDGAKPFSTDRRRGFMLCHSMPRWDATGRENHNAERRATAEDRLIKDDSILRQVLNETATSDLLVLATWNDLGEGTGINRAYDYYWNGSWKPPHHFLNLIRRSQLGEHLK